ncbi:MULTISPECIES: ATP-grasp domain-containing protein [unclassified Aureimonas]|uniref:ATP-grasp domain-containing protein n=1 Tax=unclassified Aureimonas TaxID=2615206 RepID=UPI000709EFCD|nr:MULTISPECIES: RimK family alpha-L-glutamate ligase [unclassified Aureimonas]KQT69992.1 RimK family alpha-L-glutamate ligase [Aureimonas sp. Leaf427]KQT75852.1 RimK family alpha-L-glutamate ligase [Aureimonas sp. Leaf460]
MPPSADRAAGPPAPRIALVTAAMDRHARDMLKALRAAGAEASAVKLSDVAYDSEAPSGLLVPGFGTDLPDAVCVRTMDGGSFEQVTRRLGLLHALGRLGVLVSNDAPAIEACVDKSMTSFRLARAGIASPRSFVVESREAAADILASESGPLVLKPLFGAQGKGLALIRTADDLPEPDAVSGVYYLQRFAGHPTEGTYSDYRILVSAGRAVASMRRRSTGWITNIKQGAEGLAMPPDPELERLAERSAEAVGADFCGVDLLRDADGAAQVIEVNSMPAWTGLQAATGLDIPAIRARDLLATLAARRLAEAPRLALAV